MSTAAPPSITSDTSLNDARLAPPVSHRVSIESYLTAERKASLRHEYSEGVVREIPIGTYEHSLIGANTIIALAGVLEALDYSVLSSDQKVYIDRNVFYYPNVCVVEGDPQIVFDEAIRNPVIIVEVLSTSTERNDRGEKWENYRGIPSLRHYLLVNQERPFVEHYAKGDKGLWVLVGEPKGLDAQLTFANPDIRVPLSKIYRRVTFATSAIPGDEEETA